MHRKPGADRRKALESTRTRHDALGFTLIETLLSIALIGILVGLLLPGLSGVRDRAREAVSLGQLRSHAQIMHIYTADYRGYFPIYSKPDGTGTITVGGRMVRLNYFIDRYVWPWAMADEYYNGQFASDVFWPPGYRPGPLPYKYTVSYLAVPEFWSTRTRTGPEQWRGIIADRTAWPSAKGLIISWAAAWDGTKTELKHDTPCETVFVDGSARIILHGDFNRPMVSGEGIWPGHITMTAGFPVTHTLNGALGRDVD